MFRSHALWPALLLTLASPALADGPCAADNKPSELIIADCSRAIAAGSLRGRELAAAHVVRGNAYQTRAIVQRLARRNPAAAMIDVSRTITDFSAAIELDRTYAAAFVRRGVALHDKSDFDAAIGDFDEAIRLDPKHAGAYNNRALAHAKKGEHVRAIADFTQALRLVPDPAAPDFEDSDPYFNRGISYLEARDYAHALADFDAMLQRNPADADALFGRGRTHAAQGRVDRALEDLNRAVALNPWPGALVARGDALEKKGDLAAALADYRKALAAAPDDKEAQDGVKRLRQKLGQ